MDNLPLEKTVKYLESEAHIKAINEEGDMVDISCTGKVRYNGELVGVIV